MEVLKSACWLEVLNLPADCKFKNLIAGWKFENPPAGWKLNIPCDLFLTYLCVNASGKVSDYQSQWKYFHYDSDQTSYLGNILVGILPLRLPLFGFGSYLAFLKSSIFPLFFVFGNLVRFTSKCIKYMALFHDKISLICYININPIVLYRKSNYIKSHNAAGYMLADPIWQV